MMMMMMLNIKYWTEAVMDSDTVKGFVHSGFELVQFSEFGAWNDWT